VILTQDQRPVAVIEAPQGPDRKVSECIALAKAYEERLGYAPVPNCRFAADVQAAIDAHREPLEPPTIGLILDSGVLIAPSTKRGR
jgi:hypothetical protein